VDTAAAVRQYHRIAASLAGAPHSPLLQRLLRQMGRDVAGLRAAAAAALEAPDVSPEEAQVQQRPTRPPPLPIECSLVMLSGVPGGCRTEGLGGPQKGTQCNSLAY